ncbi:GNAT family N-acetyltransferase [Paucibacter soli]|uniref:GNAT family N-acetyltransferase n=1 Tax=Paucibacter soli TaxID=3133433 RepID=UPI0030B13A2E
MTNAVSLRTLAPHDGPALLHFELENRAWFEQHIEARPEPFYAPQGVQAHIADLLAQHERSEFHPLLIVGAQGQILGRANLKGIDRQAGCAELGYRIGQAHTGQGLASLAVREMVRLARERWGLRTLLAFVSEVNPASARVLEKHGFERAELRPGLALVQGREIDCFRFQRELLPA